MHGVAARPSVGDLSKHDDQLVRRSPRQSRVEFQCGFPTKIKKGLSISRKSLI